MRIQKSEPVQLVAKTHGYFPASFRWRWSGTGPAGIEWRFDILIFQRNAASQYKTIDVDPAEVELDGDVYTKIADRFSMQCSSYWAVRVSQYVDGRFRKYLSESSNRQDIGVACATPIPAQPRPRPAQPLPPGGAGSGRADDSGRVHGPGSPSATDPAARTGARAASRRRHASALRRPAHVRRAQLLRGHNY